MNKLKITITVFFVLVLTFTYAQSKLILHTENAETKINKEIYGHFAEHLGLYLWWDLCG